MKILFFLLFVPSIVFAYPEELIRIRREIEDTAVPYFIDHAHPATGLTRDKARNFAATGADNKVASLASTGFGLTVIAHAAVMGKLPYAQAEEHVLKTLRFVYNSVPHYRGWLLHFVDWSNGQRAWNSEFSTIDTALFLAGALYAAKVFHHTEISNLTHKIYERVDFHSPMTDDGKNPAKRTLSLSYTPESGWVPYQWETYSEQSILLILGLGHPVRPLPPETWRAWKRDLMGIHMPLFIHQYSQVFIDFRSIPEKIWEAGLQSTLLHRQTGVNGFWGWSAGESPDGYVVNNPIEHTTSICIGCALGSAMYAPEIVMRDVYDWKNGTLGKKLWGRYGLTDSLDISRNWFSPYVLGITKGPEYLSIQNMEGRTSIWKDFMAIPEIKNALKKI